MGTCCLSGMPVVPGYALSREIARGRIGVVYRRVYEKGVFQGQDLFRETEVRDVMHGCILADEFVRPGVLSETDAVAQGTRLLRDNMPAEKMIARTLLWVMPATKSNRIRGF